MSTAERRQSANLEQKKNDRLQQAVKCHADYNTETLLTISVIFTDNTYGFYG
jgi:hypothetical protein